MSDITLLTECHPFEIFLPLNFNKIIIGTFPCKDFNRDSGCYGIWYYTSSRRNYFWKILHKLDEKIDINEEHTMRKVLEDLNIGIADIASLIKRRKNTCNDNDFEILSPNKILLEVIHENPDLQLLFTSLCAERATRKFYEERYKFPISPDRIKVLLSPSPSYNRGIAQTEEYKKFKNKNPTENTISFRVNQYIDIFKTEILSK